METVQEFSDELNDKLGDKVIVVAVWGSVPKGEHGYESDIDTLVILDDTKLENDVPKDAKKKIRKKVTQLAKDTDERITIQYFPFLTEFWDALRKGEPLAIEAVRNGEAVYDTGVFMPAKRLLERGKISGTRESVRKRLKASAAGYKKAEKQVRSSTPHKLEQAMASAGQAPIMLSGQNPPAKEDVPDTLEDMFVEEGLLEEEYVEMARDLHEFGNKGEKHADEVTGEEVEEHLNKMDEFIKRMQKLVSQIRARNQVKGLMDDYKKFLKANVAKLKEQDIEPPEDREDLPEVVKEELEVDDQVLEMFDEWEEVIEKVRNKDLEDLSKKQLYELKSRTRDFVSDVGKDLKEAKEEIEPEVDPDEVAREAGEEEMPSPDQEIEDEEDQEDSGNK